MKSFAGMKRKEVVELVMKEPAFKKLLEMGYVVCRTSNRAGSIHFAYPKEFMGGVAKDKSDRFAYEMDIDGDLLKTKVVIHGKGEVSTYVPGSSLKKGTFDSSSLEGWLEGLDLAEKTMTVLLDILDHCGANTLRTPELRWQKRGHIISNKFGF